MRKLLLTAAALLISVNAAYADGDNKVGKNVKIQRAAAEAIALKEVPGTVLDADIEKRKTGIFWDIDVKPSDGSVAKKKVRLDANTGAVISVKADDDKDDAKDKKD
jgi:uncharacterized membrane protein YkoI